MNVVIYTMPFIICLEAVLVGVTVRTAVSLSAAIPLGTSTKRADFLKELIFCRFLSSVDSHKLFFSVSGHPARRSCIRG